jgi:outer membrane beta-barrel protein
MSVESMNARAVALTAFAFLMVAPVSSATAQESAAPESVVTKNNRATIQHRFATKTNTVYAHLTGATSLRNDFSHTLGLGLDVGYYFSESLGAELRWMWLSNWEVEAAAEIRRDTGLVPDARPQDMLLTVGPRYSIGYGKMLVFDAFLVHFDPQLIAGAGLTFAEERALPTATFGLSLLTHFAHGIQAKIDMQVALQFEHRNRGWVSSLGFMPVFGLGWSYQGLGGSGND